MKVFAISIFLLVSNGLAQDVDPRAISLSKQRGAEVANKLGYRRDETAFSIVVYGAHDAIGTYRVLGVDHEMKLKELTEFLKSFYSGFPKDAKTHDKRINAPVPFPNILYGNRGWNEANPEGRRLVTELSKEHGVALYYFSIVPGFSSSFEAHEGVPFYEAACIDYYQRRINEVASEVKTQTQVQD